VILHHFRQGESVLWTLGWFVLDTSVCGGDASRTSSLEPTRHPAVGGILGAAPMRM
jgi:hypothetical protein